MRQTMLLLFAMTTALCGCASDGSERAGGGALMGGALGAPAGPIGVAVGAAVGAVAGALTPAGVLDGSRSQSGN
jgi:uncharacterized membrane protein